MHCCHLSRRGFIGGTAAPGLAGALFAKPSVAAPAATLIDTHHHFFPPAYQKAWLEWEDARRVPHFPSQVAWSKSKAIEEMDEAGIRTAVLSIASTPGVWFDLDAERASQMARDCNDYAANPMMAGRIDAFYGKRPNLKEFAPEGILGELRRLNYDTANATSAPTMAALTKLVPASQITYGTDYPYFGLRQFKTLEDAGLSASELESIGSGNATRLIPRLRN